MPPLLAAIEAGTDLAAVPGAVIASGFGADARASSTLDDLLPARDLLRHRRNISSACSTRAPRSKPSQRLPVGLLVCSAAPRPSTAVLPGDEPGAGRRGPPGRSAEPGVFVSSTMSPSSRSGRDGARRRWRSRCAGITKRYGLETRGDVLLRNKEWFRLWRQLGVACIPSAEALDEEVSRQISQAGAARAQFRGARLARSVARRPHRDQPDRLTPTGTYERFRIVREWCDRAARRL